MTHVLADPPNIVDYVETDHDHYRCCVNTEPGERTEILIRICNNNLGRMLVMIS